VRDAARENTTWLSRLTITAMAVSVIFIGIGIASLIHTILVRRKRLATLQLNHLPRRERRALAKQLRFYLHMLDLLERRGHVRPAWQSPFSFATGLTETAPDKFSPVVSLTEHFYEIRFGHRGLDEPRRQSIRQHLKQLEQNLPVVSRKARKSVHPTHAHLAS
jgi:hypothetical protein